MKLFFSTSVALLFFTAPLRLAEGKNNDHGTIGGKLDHDQVENASNVRSRTLAIPISGGNHDESYRDGVKADKPPSKKATGRVDASAVPSEKSEQNPPAKMPKAFGGDDSIKTKKAKAEKLKTFEKLKKAKSFEKLKKAKVDPKSFKGFKSDKANKDKLTKFGKSEKTFKSDKRA